MISTFAVPLYKVIALYLRRFNELLVKVYHYAGKGHYPFLFGDHHDRVLHTVHVFTAHKRCRV